MNVGVDLHALKRLLIAEWQPEGEYDPAPMEKVLELVAEKYERDDWNRRR